MRTKDFRTLSPYFCIFQLSYDTLYDSEMQIGEYFENKKGIYHNTFLHK